MRLPRLIFSLVLISPVVGCGGYLSVESTQSLTKVKVGMTREEVIRTVGEPQRSEVVGKTELLTYKTDWSVRLADNFTPVGIVEGKVAGFGSVYGTGVRLNLASPTFTPAAAFDGPKTCFEAHQLCKSKFPTMTTECAAQRQWCMSSGSFVFVGTGTEVSDLARR